MQIDKQQIIQMLRDQGDHEKAQHAEKRLPDKVDHQQHENILQELGINPQELLSKL